MRESEKKKLYEEAFELIRKAQALLREARIKHELSVRNKVT